MIKNYLKVAWRNLLKNKTFSVINVSGLAIGIAAFLLIVNYLRFEYSYDNFHLNKNRIYRVPMTQTETGGKPQTLAFTFPAAAPALKKDYPEIEEAVRFRIQWGVVTNGDKKFIEDAQIFYVDPAVFKVFSFEFENGTPATAFTELNDAVITKETAEKYYGTADAVGRTFRYRNENFVVKAVLKNVPSNSHIKFHILLNYNKYIQSTGGRANTSWGWSDFYTYILLKPNADVKALQAKMPAFAERYLGESMKNTGFTTTFHIQPLEDLHLRSSYGYELGGNGNLTYLKYLGIAALIILFIAWINYVNLSTARSLERSKEVGVRKVVGAGKLQLIRQFLAESLLVNIISLALGVLIFQLSLPGFSQLIGKSVADMHTASWQFWGVMLIVFLGGTLLAGFYPAFVLSSFNPMQTLKSAAGSVGVGRNRNVLRKSLVILQFTAAIVFISGAIGYYRQLQFMSKRDLGVNIKQTLVLRETVGQDSSRINTVESFMNELRALPGVKSLTVSSDVPGGEVGNSTSFRKITSTDEKRCRTQAIDDKFIPEYGLTLLAGRNFSNDLPATDTSHELSIIINETASKILGFATPQEAINVQVDGGGFHSRIVGVIKDYHQESLRNSFDPTVYYPDIPINMGMYSLKLNTPDVQKVVDQSRKIWNAKFPESPFEFFFLDAHFNEQYRSDKLFSTVIWLFTILAIIVASLGLFGLSLYTVSKRTKEISVRKVLGASVYQITAMITKDYMKLILYAGIIAIPVAYLLLSNWLKDYAFRISIGYWFFLAPLLLIMIIALVTVLYQSVRAALSNPVKSLRTE